jgi:hypothetical protein
MRVGTVFGPFPGLFLVDVGAKTVTMREGVKGVVGEVTLQLTDGQVADLLEGILVDPMTPQRVRTVRGGGRSLEVTCAGEKCGAVFLRGRGRAPKLCPLCRVGPRRFAN